MERRTEGRIDPTPAADALYECSGPQQGRLLPDAETLQAETMRNANGVGLAANQIGLNKQIFVVDVSPVEGFEKYKPIAMINPKIISKSDDTDSIEEGCLSIPELRAEVIRPKSILHIFF